MTIEEKADVVAMLQLCPDHDWEFVRQFLMGHSCFAHVHFQSVRVGWRQDRDGRAIIEPNDGR